MFWNRTMPEKIVHEFKKLKRTPSGRRHADQYHYLKSLITDNQDSLYELVFSPVLKKNISASDLSDLIFFGGHGGSVAKEYNLHWIPFLKRIRERQEELPEIIQYHFDWLGRVHYYWED